MVIYDGRPPRDITGPWESVPQGAGWSGDTYMAYIDFVSGRADLHYLTVDCDYGCGTIFKRKPAPSDSMLVDEWKAQHNYLWLQGKGRALLYLVSPEELIKSFATSNQKNI